MLVLVLPVLWNARLGGSGDDDGEEIKKPMEVGMDVSDRYSAVAQTIRYFL